MKPTKFIFLILLFHFCLNAGYSQKPTISKEELKAVITDISKKLKSTYVFPELADKMADAISKNLASGAYDNLTDPAEVSKKITEDLLEISKDKHIGLEYNPGGNQNNRGKKGPSPEAVKRWKERNRKGNYGFSKVEILPGNVGLITLDGFTGFMKEGGPVADAVMSYVSNSDALIFDLRSNGGGSPDMIIHLTSFLLKEKTNINNFYFRKKDKITESWTTKKVNGKKLDHLPVYIVTSNRTFSAAEEFTYNLKHLKRATVIGEVTGGGANPGGIVPIDKNFVMFIPDGRAINPITKTNWEGVGVIPHIEVSEEKALEKAHITALEKLAEKATDSEKDRLDVLIKNIKGKGKNIQLSVEELQKYTGDYLGGLEPTISIKDKGLVIGSSRKTMSLSCIGKDLFVTEDNFRVQFESDDNGKISGLKILTPDGRTMDCPRK